MATFSNESKNTSTFTNETFGGADITWNEANFTWEEAEGTWNAPKTSYHNEEKSATSFTNVAKSD